MKRDWDLIRKILLATESIESTTPRNDHINYQTMKEECTGEEFWYQITLLNEANLIIAKPSPDSAGGVVYRLTWAGHEFLDSIRNDTTWNKIKNSTTEKGLELSFDSIKELAKHFLVALVSSQIS